MLLSGRTMLTVHCQHCPWAISTRTLEDCLSCVAVLTNQCVIFLTFISYEAVSNLSHSFQMLVNDNNVDFQLSFFAASYNSGGKPNDEVHVVGKTPH